MQSVAIQDRLWHTDKCVIFMAPVVAGSFKNSNSLFPCAAFSFRADFLYAPHTIPNQQKQPLAAR
jgi:hypothetical protein